MPKPEHQCGTCKHFDDTGHIKTGAGQVNMCDQGCGICRLRPTGAAQEMLTSWTFTAFSVVLATDGCSDWQVIPAPPEE